MLESAVRGFHVYHEAWAPVLGEELTTKNEPGNSGRRGAVRCMWLGCRSSPAGNTKKIDKMLSLAALRTFHDPLHKSLTQIFCHFPR